MYFFPSTKMGIAVLIKAKGFGKRDQTGEKGGHPLIIPDVLAF